MVEMKKTELTSALSLILILIALLATTASAQNDEAERAKIKAAMELPPAERIEKLKAFIDAHPQSQQRVRAMELVVSARAAIGDQKLRAGDATGGIEQFKLALSEGPAGMSDKLFNEVISQLPLNLFVRNQRDAAFELARLIEARVSDDSRRLLILAGFYLRIEEGTQAARLAELAIKLSPDMAAAYQVLGQARHIALQLDQAAAAYARALEIDPAFANARRSLADLRRAAGKAEEALALYRELVKADPSDNTARAGLVLSLLELNKKEEAEREMAEALAAAPRNLGLLVGAAYWYAAHNDAARALELARKAVEVEPRYTWGQIAQARALLAAKRPLDADRAILFARQYGRFPTLDYEYATVLVSIGLYDEAGEELARSFALKGNQIETLLAGRVQARAANFIELLAPERRAGIFQFTAADDEHNARILKSLLSFTLAMNPQGEGARPKESEVVAAAREFASGEDAMRTFRQIYAANRLLRAGLALPVAIELTEASMSGVDAAADTPGATVATLAEELSFPRQRAISAGGTPDIPNVPRNVLTNIMRGRIEDILGWAMFNQDNATEAASHLRRAVSVLPENTVWWRTAHWHLGAALETNGSREEALAAYFKGYNKKVPDPARRAVLEALYRKVNGSLDGFDAKLGEAPPPATLASEAGNTATQQTSTATNTTTDAKTTAQTATVSDSLAPATSAAPSPQPAPTPASGERADATKPTETSANASAPTETPSSQTQTSATETAPASEQQQSGAGCVLSVSETMVAIGRGGSAIVTVSFTGLNGSDDVKASTKDWADVVVLSNTKPFTGDGSIVFLVNSTSNRMGNYTVTFTSPCGTKELKVAVR
jgi:tetratricopeptide (TPR) repeat protein